MTYAPTLHKSFATSVAIAATATITACSGQSTPAATTVTHTSTVIVTQPAATSAIAEPAPVDPTPPAAVPATAPTNWTMPDLIGRNLQLAQDEIQRITANAIFYTSSTDLTGKSRNQIMDRNWQVCSSTPPPGSTITKDTSIDFGVVRIDSESCP